jgi:general transcription factor IIIA
VNPTDDEAPHKSKAKLTMDIDMITGNAYTMHAQKKVQDAKALRCPYPHIEKMVFVRSQDVDTEAGLGTRLLCGPDCDYVFSRAYDLRRHMRSVHKIDTEKESVNQWVEVLKRR